MRGSIIVYAGVDPTGSAGLTLIASTARLLGVYSATVPSSLVVEGLGGVSSLHPVDVNVARAMLEAALSDVKPIVSIASSIPSVEHARLLRLLESSLVILDPVWRASAGGLLTVDEPRRVVHEALRYADILVLNYDELSVLEGAEPRVSSIVSSARRLLERHGLAAVIVKGGGSPLECRDVVVEPDYWSVIGEPLGCLDARVHGTGCVYIAALSSMIVHGYTLLDAAWRAWRIARSVVEASSGGLARVETLASYWVHEVLEDAREALRMLLAEWRLVERHVPEVGLNVVSVAPVGVWAGVDGRVRRGVQGPVYGPVALYASSHLRRAVETVSRYAPWVRGAVNIAYSEVVVEAARRAGYVISWYDRRLEPPEVKAVEGGSIPWGFRWALSRVEPLVPDLVYHRGDLGKEPMIVVLGGSAREAVEKLLDILGRVEPGSGLA